MIESLLSQLVFTREYMRAALLVSLLSVWMLVFLFFYLNRFTRRSYFSAWAAAWLFYALWLTLGLSYPAPESTSYAMLFKQWCVGLSAVFILWGSLEFLELKARQTLFALFIAFLLTWSYVSPRLMSNPLLVQLPIFTLVGLASIVAALSFYPIRVRRQFIGGGLLFFGFLMWGCYLAAYPFTLKYEDLFGAGFLVSAVLQLFIAVSMIVLVLEETRQANEQVRKQIESVNNEKEALQLHVYNAEEQFRGLLNQARHHAELQKAYEELRQTQQSVMQQERLRALGQMASGIAHDINNSLSPVLAFSEMLLRKEDGLSAQGRKNLEHVRLAAEDIAHIVSRMKEFYRRCEPKEQLRLINLNHLVQQVMELTRPRWQDMPQSQGVTIQVQANLDPTLPELFGNESDVREALTNLLLNSMDALPHGGGIDISTRGLRQNQDGPSQAQPTHLVLQVRDNGIGMDAKTRRRCLEPFFSTKRDRGGTGLGLAMVFGMMERHEGAIEVDSEPGKGTTIRLSD